MEDKEAEDSEVEDDEINGNESEGKIVFEMRVLIKERRKIEGTLGMVLLLRMTFLKIVSGIW